VTQHALPRQLLALGWFVDSLWLNRFSQQLSDAALEVAILDSVDERVDAAAGEHHCDTHMVEPARVAGSDLRVIPEGRGPGLLPPKPFTFG